MTLTLLIYKSRLALAFYIFFKEHVFPIIDCIGKLSYPVAQNHHAGFMACTLDGACQIDVKLDMAVTEDKVVDIGMLLYVLLGKEH